jgi:hypothetical protein
MPLYTIEDEDRGLTYDIESDAEITDFEPHIKQARFEAARKRELKSRFPAERAKLAGERTSTLEQLPAGFKETWIASPKELKAQVIGGLAEVGQAGWQGVTAGATLLYPGAPEIAAAAGALSESMLATNDLIKKSAELPEDEQTVMGKFVRTGIASLPPLALGPAGLTAVAIGSGAQVALGAYRDDKQALLKQGFAEKDAADIAARSAVWKGLITTVTTRLGGKHGVEKVLDISKHGVKAVKDFLLRELPQEALSEFGEEGIDQWAQAIVDRAAINPQMTWGDLAKQGFEAGTMGMLLGGGAAGVKYGIDRWTAPPEEQQPAVEERPKDAEGGGTGGWANVPRPEQDLTTAQPTETGFSLVDDVIMRDRATRTRVKREMEAQAPRQRASPENILVIANDLASRTQNQKDADELRFLAASKDTQGIANLLGLTVDPKAQGMPDRYRHLTPHEERPGIGQEQAEQGMTTAPPDLLGGERTEAELLRSGSPVELAIERGRMERAERQGEPVSEEELYDLANRRIDATADKTEQTVLRRLVERRDTEGISRYLGRPVAEPSTTTPTPTPPPEVKKLPRREGPQGFIGPRKPAPTAPPPTPPSGKGATPEASFALAKWVVRQLESGKTWTNQELYDEANKHFGGTQAQGAYTPKDAYDAQEIGINTYVQQVRFYDDVATTQGAVVGLKKMGERVPTQTRRTGEQQEFQQFSTPPALAYVVNWVAGPHQDDVVLEPSAGLGGIAIFASAEGAEVHVNELSERRRALLAFQPWATTHGVNAEHVNALLPQDIKPTVILMNPPFSATAGRLEGTRDTMIGAKHLQSALERLQPGGRLVAIMGEGMADNRPAFRRWWSQIKETYNVRANIGISGEEYRKYGTTFGNQIIVIDKTGPSTAPPITGQVAKIEDLVPLLQGVRNERQVRERTEPPGKPPRPGTPGAPEGTAGGGEPLGPTPGVGDESTGTLGEPPGLPPGGSGAETEGAGGGPTVPPPKRRQRGRSPKGPTTVPPGVPGGTGPAPGGGPAPGPTTEPTGGVPGGPDQAPVGDAAFDAEIQRLGAELERLMGDVSSLNPQVFIIGTQLAYQHLKAGVRKFKAFVASVRQKLPKLWDQIKKHLHGFWTSATVDYPDAEEVTRADATAAIAEVEKPEAPQPPAPPKGQPEAPPPIPGALLTAPENILRIVDDSPEAQAVINAQSHFDEYTPKIAIEAVGGLPAIPQPHPGELSESSTMAAVPYPKVTYKHSLPIEIISQGILSHAQLEGVVLCGQAHQKFNPNGSRRGWMTGDGCVAGETLIYDPIKDTHTPIWMLAMLGQPIHVLSLTAEGFKPMPATAPFFKGIEDLYRVTLDDGRSIIVTDRHRFLTPDSWTRICDGLRPGQLLRCGASRLPSTEDSDRPIPFAGGQRCLETASSSLANCSSGCRPGDEPLLPEEGSGQELLPLPACAGGHSRALCDGDESALSPGCNRQHPHEPHRARSSSGPLGTRGPSRFSGPASASIATRLSRPLQGVQQSATGSTWLPRSAVEVQPEAQGYALPALCSRPPVYEFATTSRAEDGRWHRIASIHFERRDAYYDMHVPGPENYLAHGIVNHNTGTGKTRMLGAIILDHWRKGGRNQALWISDKHDLADQAAVDLAPLGISNDQIHTVVKRGENPAVPLGGVIPKKPGILFTAYSHFQRPTKTGTKADGTTQNRTQQIADWLGPDFDGVIILDEAQGLRNSRGTGPRDTGAEQAKQITALITRYPRARVVFSSATNAVELKDVAYLERLGLWGPETPFANLREFLTRLAGGGIAAMEKLTADMKAMGGYIARSLSMRGVNYEVSETKLNPNQIQIYDRIADAWAEVNQHFEDYLHSGAIPQGVRNNLSSTFWSANQRCMSDLITAFKLPETMARIEDDLAAGRSAVVQLADTGAEQEKRALGVAQAEGRDLSEISMNPTENLVNYIRQFYPVTVWTVTHDENGQPQDTQVMDANKRPVQDPERVRRRDALIAQLRQIASPESVFKQLENTFGFSKVAEVTGRDARLEHQLDSQGNRVAKYVRRSKDKRNVDIEMFMDGDKRVLVFSAAGGTGRSYHSDMRRKNQQQRVHYLLQPGWQAIQVIQGTGRTNRTYQREKPFYRVMSTDLPGEKRFTSTIARRLDQLGALTKGHRKTAGGGMYSEADNFESEYAISALSRVWNDLWAGRIEGMDLQVAQRAMGSMARQPDMQKFLNRVLNLPVQQQHVLLDALTRQTLENIQVAKENGTYSEGVQNIENVQSEVVHSQVLYRHPDSGAETQLVEINLTANTFYRAWLPGTDPGQNVIGYVKQVRSGRVYGFEERHEHTLPDQRTNILRRRLQGITRSDVVDETEFNDPGQYQEIDAEEAQRWWENFRATAPKVYHDTAYLLTGVLLPVWNRIPAEASHQMYRIDLSDGRRLLGRRILDSRHLTAISRAFGVSVEAGVNLDPAGVFNAVFTNSQTVELTNHQRLARRRVSGEWRIEVLDATEGGKRNLVNWGAIREDINFASRIFIPTDPTRGVPIIERMLRNNPIVSVSGSNPDASISPEGRARRGGQTEANLQRIAKQEGAQNVTVIRDESARDGTFVVEAETLVTTGEIRLNLAFMPDAEEDARAVIREEIAHQWLNSAQGRWLMEDWMTVHFTDAHLAAFAAQGYKPQPGETPHQFRRRMAGEFVAKQHRQQTSWWRRMVDAVRSYLHRIGLVRLKPEEAARAILRALKHRQRFTAQDNDATELDETGSRTNRNDSRTGTDPLSPQEQETLTRRLELNTDADTTVVHGIDRAIVSRPGGPGVFEQSLEFAAQTLDRLRIPWRRDNLDIAPQRPLTSLEAESLVDALRQVIQQVRDNQVLSAGRLLNFALKAADSRVAGQANPLPEEIRNRLINVAQSERSVYGIRLAELRKTGKLVEILSMGFNTSLTGVYRDQFMPEDMERLIEDAHREARETIDLQAALSDPALQKTLEGIFRQHGLAYNPEIFRAWLFRSWGRHWTSRQGLAANIAEALSTDYQIPANVAEGVGQLLADGIMPHFRDRLLSALRRRRTGGREWHAVIAAIRSGNTSVESILRQLAASNGWSMPKPADVEKIETALREWDALSRLSQEEMDRAAAGIDPQDKEALQAAWARARDRKHAATENDRAGIVNQVSGLWSRWTRPMGVSTFEKKRATNDAANAMLAANLLLTPSFATRQIIDVTTQTAGSFVTRPLAGAAIQIIDAVRANRPGELGRTVLGELVNAQQQAIAALPAAWRAAQQGFLLRGTSRETPGGFDQDISAFSRWNELSREHWEKGNNVRSSIYLLLTWLQLSFRYAAALDELSKTVMRNPEFMRMLTAKLRDMGQTAAEAQWNAGIVIRDVFARIHQAEQEVATMYSLSGVTTNPRQMAAARDNLLLQYAREELMTSGIPGAALSAVETMLQARAWNLKERGGFGGVLARSIESFQHMPVIGAMGVFGNAMGIALNRTLMWSPVGFFPDMFADWKTGEKSNWYASRTDIAERRIEATIGTSMWGILMTMAAYGLIRVWSRGPRDREEREAWMAAGHRPGTIEFHYGDGRFFRQSTTSGPWNLIRGPVHAVGAYQDVMEAAERKTERMQAAGESIGEPMTGIETILGRTAGVFGRTMVALAGSRTMGGAVNQWVNQYTDEFEARNLGGVMGGYVPYAPLVRSAGRLANKYTDPQIAKQRLDATEAALLVLPDVITGAQSAAPKMNIFWEPMVPGGAAQVLDALTGNLVGWGDATPSDRAWAVLGKAKFYPSAPYPGQAVRWLSDYRLAPMPEKAYLKFRASYGPKFRALLESFDDEAMQYPASVLAGMVKASDRQAEAEALYEMGYAPR